MDVETHGVTSMHSTTDWPRLKTFDTTPRRGVVKDQPMIHRCITRKPPFYVELGRMGVRTERRRDGDVSPGSPTPKQRKWPIAPRRRGIVKAMYHQEAPFLQGIKDSTILCTPVTSSHDNNRQRRSVVVRRLQKAAVVSSAVFVSL